MTVTSLAINGHGLCGIDGIAEHFEIQGLVLADERRGTTPAVGMEDVHF